MKFLCDVHISIKLAKRFTQLGFQTNHVNNILEKWHTKDNDIAEYADQNGLILITKDQDFRNTFLLKQQPKRLVKINLGNISNDSLINLILLRIDDLNTLYQSFEPFMVEINSDNYWIVTK